MKIRFLRHFAYWPALFGYTATVAFAQTSSFGQAAQGIAKMLAIAKWVGIIVCIIWRHRPDGRWIWYCPGPSRPTPRKSEVNR